MCATAFYHLAMDVGIQADTRPNFFSTQQLELEPRLGGEAAAASSPAFTEPNWSGDIGVLTYPVASSNLESTITAVGVFTMVFSVIMVNKIQSFLVGLKVL